MVVFHSVIRSIRIEGVYKIKKQTNERWYGLARAPNEKALKAEQLYKQGLKLIDISGKLGVPEGTIRSWKNRYKWDDDASATLQKRKRNVAKGKGGQPGNKNALGHGAPKQNKNAVTTGEFETLFFDCLEPDEQELIEQIQLDKNQLLLQEIQLLTVRERRMLKRIEALKKADEEQNGKEQGMTAVKYKTGTEKDKDTDLFEYVGILGQIQNIENALTRVQASKQRAIDSLHRYGYDDARLEIELMKIELELAKQDTSEDIQEDDGFMDAINSTAAEVWGDDDV